MSFAILVSACVYKVRKIREKNTYTVEEENIFVPFKRIQFSDIF